MLQVIDTFSFLTLPFPRFSASNIFYKGHEHQTIFIFEIPKWKLRSRTLITSLLKGIQALNPETLILLSFFIVIITILVFFFLSIILNTMALEIVHHLSKWRTMLSLITIYIIPYLRWTLIQFGYAIPDILRVHYLLYTIWKVQNLPKKKIFINIGSFQIFNWFLYYSNPF